MLFMKRLEISGVTDFLEGLLKAENGFL
jgi:hypothetical protein